MNDYRCPKCGELPHWEAVQQVRRENPDIRHLFGTVGHSNPRAGELKVKIVARSAEICEASR